jgi:hypothetical protein
VSDPSVAFKYLKNYDIRNPLLFLLLRCGAELFTETKTLGSVHEILVITKNYAKMERTTSEINKAFRKGQIPLW